LTRLILGRISTNDTIFMSPDIPHQLIESIKSGDKHAFGKLIDLCSQYVYEISYKMVGNADDAHDAAQESLIKVWEKINTYKVQFKFTTWLYKLVINTCLDKLRQRSRENELFKQEENMENLQESIVGNAVVEFEEKQFVEFIRIISGKLSAKQHSVFVLHDLEGLNQEEISNIMGMPKGRVKSNLYYARKAIRQLLVSADKAKIRLNYEV